MKPDTETQAETPETKSPKEIPNQEEQASEEPDQEEQASEEPEQE